MDKLTPRRGKSSVLDGKVNQYEETMKQKFIAIMNEKGIKYADCLDYIQNEIEQSKKMSKFHYKIPCFKNDGIYQLNQAISRIHRLGSDTQVCINICALDTGNLPNITTRTVDILKWSQEEIEKITGTPCAYAIGDVLTYKDIDAMQAPIHTGVSELALKTDPLADKFTRFIKRIRPMSNVRRWKYGNS